MSSLLAIDDGIFQGNLDFADILFLVAAVVFAIAFILRVIVRPIPLDSVMIAAGLTCLAIGWLVL